MRDRPLDIVALCGAALLSLYGSAVPACGYVPENHAIVVGVGTYPEDSGWSRIHGDRDVSMVTGMLVRNGFAEENIVRLVGERATKETIRNAFLALQSDLEVGDGVYVHFSGHGQQMTDLDGDEEDGRDEAFVPYDAGKEYVRGEYEGENHITDDELYQWLAALSGTVGKSGLVMVVMDACHSGDATRGPEQGTEDTVLRGVADVFEIPVDAMSGNALPVGIGGFPKQDGPERGISWICLSACKSFQNNHEYRSEEGYYGRLTWAMNEVFEAGMSLDDLVSGIKEVFSSLPLPQGPPQTPDFVCPGRRKVRLFQAVDAK